VVWTEVGSGTAQKALRPRSKAGALIKEPLIRFYRFQ
jgi:hypothetical protein